MSIRAVRKCNVGHGAKKAGPSQPLALLRQNQEFTNSVFGRIRRPSVPDQVEKASREVSRLAASLQDENSRDTPMYDLGKDDLQQDKPAAGHSVGWRRPE